MRSVKEGKHCQAETPVLTCHRKLGAGFCSAGDGLEQMRCEDLKQICRVILGWLDAMVKSGERDKNKGACQFKTNAPTSRART